MSLRLHFIYCRSTGLIVVQPDLQSGCFRIFRQIANLPVRNYLPVQSKTAGTKNPHHPSVAAKVKILSGNGILLFETKKFISSYKIQKYDS